MEESKTGAVAAATQNGPPQARTARRKPFGYIVFDEHSPFGPLSLLKRSTNCWKEVPTGGILLHALRTASEFPTRPAARAAINRTTAYFARMKKGPKHYEYTIYRLTPAVAE